MHSFLSFFSSSLDFVFLFYFHQQCCYLILVKTALTKNWLFHYMILFAYDGNLKPLILTAAAYIICMTMAIIYFRNTHSSSETSQGMYGLLS